MQRLHALGGVGSSKVRILMHHLGEEYSIIPLESQVKELHIKILNLESQLDSVVGELEMLSTLLVAHVLNRSVKHELLSLLGANQYQQMCLLKLHRLFDKQQMAQGRVSTIRTALANLIPTLDELNASPFNENLLQVNIGSPQNPETLVSGIGATFTPSSNSTTQTLKNVDIYQDSASKGIGTTRGTCSRTPVSGVSVQVISGEEREGGQAHTKQHITRRLFGGVDVALVVGPNATDQTLDPTIEQQTNNHYDTNLETPERLPFEELPLLPRGLHLRFNPKSYMCLSKKELALAAFIFGSMKSTEDKLVYTTWIELRRGQFMSICPKNCILPEILAAWACMLTSNEKATYAIQTRWYMPPFFSQRILDGCCSYYEAVSSYLYRFMGVWSACTKVFIPIKEGDNNWFLMIVDKFARKNWYVDSKPSDNMRQIRESMIREVASFMDKMLDDPRFHEHEPYARTHIAEFDIEMPKKVPKDDPDSVDDGVRVAGWMALSDLTGNLTLAPVELCRMKMVIDLVQKPYNLLHQNIVAKAKQEMDQHVQKTFGLHVAPSCPT